jgi:quinoprotein glucose dehydrogenase
MATVPRVLIIVAYAVVATALACLRASPARAQDPAASDWGYWGGDAFGRRYSSLRQIDRGNVGTLRIAWTYRTGELGAGLARADKLAFEATPVFAFGTLYLSTPTDIIIALDAATGRERWRYDPRIDRRRDYPHVTSRGVAAWSDPDPVQGAPCPRRIFEGTLDGRLLAVDADTGQLCAGFGAAGVIALGGPDAPVGGGDSPVISPPVLYRDVVIVGSSTGERAARGMLRAFDARSGAVRWSFATLPATAEHPAASDWQPSQIGAARGGAPSGVMSVDPGRGMVFVPTGSASPDFYGASRLGSNRLADSLLALDATTGKLLWDRQLIHHDLWGLDLTAQPSLIELELDGVSSTAVIEATRSGMLFVFDRESGVPVFPLLERRVPESRAPGESAAPTQPYSVLPALVSLEPASAADAWGLTFWDRGKCRERLAALRNEGAFTPPDLHGTLLYPGAIGGVDFGGIAYDPLRQRVIAAVNHLPFSDTLLEAPEWERELREQRAGNGYQRAVFTRPDGARFGLRREPLLSPFGVPCTAPPWGTLAEVDLKTRRIVWQVPLGSTEGFAPWWMPVRNFGMPGLGGPIVTAGDLVFIGAAPDAYLRAFDIETGREIWKHRLPAAGEATPMTYVAGHEPRQFVVIAAGGNGELGTPRGDWLVAFALPPSAAPPAAAKTARTAP